MGGRSLGELCREMAEQGWCTWRQQGSAMLITSLTF